MTKRGQITTIIIIVIVAIILIVTMYSFRDVILAKIFDIQYERQIKVPPQIEPIREFMSLCINEIASDGVDLIGQQGGYIDLPFESLPTSSYTPFSSALEIFPHSGIKTAFWFYERPNGIKKTNIPTISSMENELKDYINLNLKTCINNLTYYANQGFIIDIKRNPETELELLNNVVNIKVNYPLDITLKDLSFSLENHLTKVNSNLKQLYETSIEIIDKENNDNFFEEKTLDMMVAYDEIPFSGVDLSCAPKIWYKPEVIENIKDVIAKNLIHMRLKGTTEIDKYYEFDVIPPPEITANFMYAKNWPMVVEITPSDGDTMRGNQVSKKTSDITMSVLSSFVCLQDYHFVYDIKYPVLISLTDKNGYVFQFATEIIIDNNQPKENPIAQLVLPEATSPLCDFPENEVTVTTLTLDDDGTLIPLDNVDVVLKCFPAVCNSGTTNIRGSEAVLTTTFPPCLNGVLEGRKQGYYPGKEIVNTNEEQEQMIPLILEPLYKKDIILKIIDKKSGEIRDPYESEQVSILFTHKETGYGTSYVYPSEEPIELLVGDYEIQSYVIGSATWPITFPKKTIKKCVDVRKEGILAFFQKGEEKCFETVIPETKMDMALKGGVIFDYQFSRNDLTIPDMVFYTMAEPIPSSLNDMALLQQALPENKNHPNFKYPST